MPAPSFLHLQLPHGSSHQPASSCSVHLTPVVLFSVLDQYLRKPSKQQQVVGALLGVRNEDGSEVEVRNSIPLGITQTGDEFTIDHDYLAQMYTLHQRSNPRETIIGWYSTGTTPTTSSVFIHDLFANETSPFSAIHLLLDTDLTGPNMGVSTFVSEKVAVPNSENVGSMFIRVPCEVRFKGVERAALDIMYGDATTQSQSSLSIVDGQTQPETQRERSLMPDMDSLEHTLQTTLEMITRVSDYVDEVLTKEEKSNSALGRYLMDTIASVPVVDKDVFERGFTAHLQDLLMVVYLANLTRTQLAIAERLHKMM